MKNFLQLALFLIIASNAACHKKLLIPSEFRALPLSEVQMDSTLNAGISPSRSFLPQPLSYAAFQLHDELNDDGYPRDYIVTTLQVKVYEFDPGVSETDALDSVAWFQRPPAASWMVRPYYRTPNGQDASSFTPERQFRLPVQENKRLVVECLIVNGFDAFGDQRYTRKRLSFIHVPSNRIPVYTFETDEYLANIEDNHYLASIVFFRPKCFSPLFERIPANDANFQWNFNGERRTGGLLQKYVLNDMSQVEIQGQNGYRYRQFRVNHFLDQPHFDTVVVSPAFCRS